MSDSSENFMESERLGFRHWQAGDIQLAQRLWGNTRVSALIHGPFSDEQVSARLQREIDSQRTCGLQYWKIHLLDSGEFVGCCGLREHQAENDYPELGFHLLPEFWGMGLAREAAARVIRHAFDELGIEGIYAGHHPDNAASMKVLEGLGFRPAPPEFFESTGLMHPSYTLTAADREPQAGNDQS
jgi:[ribosomal protein S5]-alanine N-acetyltransferase